MARSRKKRGKDWTTVSAVVSTMTAAAALLFTGLSLRETQRQGEIAERGQVTDRFHRALDHFANAEDLLRLGGVHELHSIAKDSVRDRPAVAAVLSAAVRKRQALSQPCGLTDIGAESTAAMRALADLDAGKVADLSSTCLNLLVLHQAKLRCVQLQGSFLRGASLVEADLTGAYLSDTHFNTPWELDPHPVGAHLTRARLAGAHLAYADLSHARLEGADLSMADLRDAQLVNAVLRGVNLRGANLSGANLSGADLSGSDLTGAYIKGAVFTNTSVTREAAIRAGAFDAARRKDPASMC
jgi:uncharacterized protein YjbI with pentapeptide repeats